MGERAKPTQRISPHIIRRSFITYKVFITIYKAFHIMPSSCHTIQSSFSLYWDSSQDAKHAKPIYNIQSHFTLYRASFTPYRDPLRYKELLHTLYRAPVTPYRAPSHYKDLLHNMQTLYRASSQYTKPFHIIQSPFEDGAGSCRTRLHYIRTLYYVTSHYTNLLTLHSSPLSYSRGLPNTIAFSHHTQRVYIIQDSLQPRLTAILQEI